MSINTILQTIEAQIRDLQNRQNIQELHKLWLLFAVIRDCKVWQYNSKCLNFPHYMQVAWGYEKSHAYNLANAGRAIYILLAHPDFTPKKLPLPRKLDLAINLGKHPPTKMFTVWQDYCERGIEIPKNLKTSNPHETGSGDVLKIDEALEKLSVSIRDIC